MKFRWQESAKGNVFTRAGGGICTVFESESNFGDACYKFVFQGAFSNGYDTQEEAMEAAEEHLEDAGFAASPFGAVYER